jgi:hypothetical protein
MDGNNIDNVLQVSNSGGNLLLTSGAATGLLGTSSVEITETDTNMYMKLGSGSISIDQLNTPSPPTAIAQFKPTGLTMKQIIDMNGNNIDMNNGDIINGNDVQSNQITTNTLDSSGSIITVNKPLQVVPTNSIIDGVNNVIDFFGGNMGLTNTSPSGLIAIGSLNQIQLNASNEVKISVPSASPKLSITSSAVAIDFNANLDIQGTIIYVRPNTMPNFFIGDMTYVFVGNRSTSNSYVLPQNVKIMGTGKNNSRIDFNGGGTLFSSVDNNLSVSDITLTSSNTTGKLFDLSNVAQNKTIDMKNVQIRNTKNGMSIDGYDLIDLNNCIFTYFESGSPTPVGVNITNASKVQLSSCEFLRWFQEGGTPATTFFNGNMLEFGGTLNASNINGCLFHPQYDQNGIDLSAVSSAIEGTITSNTFIDINLNTPTFQVLVLNPTIAPSYVVEGNSIYPNLRAQLTYVFSGVNASNTILSGGSNPNVINTGGLAIALTSQFSSITAGGLATYLKKRSANFLITASANLRVFAGGSGQRVGLGLRVNGADIPNGYSFVSLDSAGTAPKQTTLNFTGVASQNDTFELTIFNASGNNDVLVSDVNFAGIEV